MHTHACTYTHAHIYTHTCTHAHTRTQGLLARGCSRSFLQPPCPRRGGISSETCAAKVHVQEKVQAKGSSSRGGEGHSDAGVPPSLISKRRAVAGHAAGMAMHPLVSPALMGLVIKKNHGSSSTITTTTSTTTTTTTSSSSTKYVWPAGGAALASPDLPPILVQVRANGCAKMFW